MQKTLFFLTIMCLINSSAYCDQKPDDNELKAFVTPGWSLLTSTKGDINMDGKDDLVIVLEKENQSKEESVPINNSGSASNISPRRLLVFLYTPSGYHMTLETNQFLPSQNKLGDECTNWSIENILVKKGNLHIVLHHEYACGSGTGGDSEFIFRYENEKFRLIGLEATFLARDIDVKLTANYLTGKMIFTYGNTEGTSDIAIKRIPLKQRTLYLNNMKSASCYDLSEYLSINKQCPEFSVTPQW